MSASEPEQPHEAGQPEEGRSATPVAEGDADADRRPSGNARANAIADATPDPPASDGSVDGLLRRFLSLPPIQVTAPPPPDPLINRTASTLPAPPKNPSHETFTQDLAEVEPLLATGNWDAVIEALSRRDTLPPPLALLYAVALNERGGKGDPHGLAIRAAAALLCVPDTSETALVVAKRLLRTNPVAWQKRSAPSAGFSIFIVLTVAIVGALVGFLVGPGGWILR